jgi:Beta-propeller repeat
MKTNRPIFKWAHYLSVLFLAFAHQGFSQVPVLEWAKSIGGTGADSGRGITVDDAGNVYTIGGFTGTVDFDPGPSVFNLTSSGMFVSKLSANGDFVWAKELGISGNSISTDVSGNIYVTGDFSGTADFDPSASTSYLSGFF